MRKKKFQEDSETYLRFGNKRLEELSKEYKNIDYAVTTPLVWVDDYIKPNDLKNFRGELYVWQMRGGYDRHNYAITTRYIQKIDKLRLFDRLTEDGGFGAYTFLVGGKIVSRDLLDSIIEIYFLERHLKIFSFSDLNIIDIGAGYGRLAHRIVSALPNVKRYFCTDAVATSSFICEYYLRNRKGTEKAYVIPLHELHSLGDEAIHVAINVHSFSECRISAIEWWCNFLRKRKIRYFMVVPNPLENRGTRLLTNAGEDFLCVIEGVGYKLVAKEPKYLDPIVQREGIYPTYHYLFELKGNHHRFKRAKKY